MVRAISVLVLVFAVLCQWRRLEEEYFLLNSKELNTRLFFNNDLMKLVFFFPVTFQRGISFYSSLWEKVTSDWHISSLKKTQKTLKWHEIFTKIKLKKK